MGGLKAVITTDVTQFIILLLGAVLTVALITAKMGGVGAWFPTEWAPTWDKFVFFSADSHIRVTIVGTFIATILWWICTAGSDQMAIQRYLATRDVRSARKALLTSGIADVGVFMLFVLVGFALLSYFRTNPHLIADGKSIIEDADFLFPHYIANLLPIGITGLVIAGLLSAAMSSFSSGINSTATVISTDFLSRLKKQYNTATNNVKLARYISISVGIVAILISSFVGKVPGNIMEITAKTNGLFITPLFSLFFMALFIPFSTPLGTIFGSIYCLYAGFLVAFWDVLTGRPGLSFQWIYPVSLLVGIVFGILFSLLPTRGKSFQVRFFWSMILIIPLLVITYFLIG